MAVPSSVKCYCSTDKPTIVWTGALGQCSRCSLRLVETVVVPHPDRPGEVPHLGSQVVLAMVPSHFPKDTLRRGSPSKTGKSWPPSACWAGQAGKPSWETGRCWWEWYSEDAATLTTSWEMGRCWWEWYSEDGGTPFHMFNHFAMACLSPGPTSERTVATVRKA